MHPVRTSYIAFVSFLCMGDLSLYKKRNPVISRVVTRITRIDQSIKKNIFIVAKKEESK